MDGTHLREDLDEVAAALAEVAHMMVRNVSDTGTMSFTTGSTLARLGREGPSRLTALAAAEGVAQPSMTQLVQRLERQGLAVRVSDPKDGRVSLVAATDAGRELLAERRQALKGRVAELVAMLAPEEQAALHEAMRTALPIVRKMTEGAALPQM